MYGGGDAAEQVVRMSLEGMEVAAKITGVGAKNLAVLIAAVLKEEQKTSGKARLTNMIKSGQELKVFTIQQKDVAKFAKEAKRYGVLYSILREKSNSDPNAEIDVIARASDAPKISRIVERFKLNSVDKASVVRELEAELNPVLAKTERDHQSLPNSELVKISRQSVISGMDLNRQDKPSVKEALAKYRSEMERQNSPSAGRNIVRGSAKKIRSVKER